FGDKAASQAKLNELVTKVENTTAGRIDPFDRHRLRPLREHLDDYTKYLAASGDTAEYVKKVKQQVGDALTGCKFVFIADISASRLISFLADLRSGGRSLATGNEKLSKRPCNATTSNHYLRAIKSFVGWL